LGIRKFRHDTSIVAVRVVNLVRERWTLSVINCRTKRFVYLEHRAAGARRSHFNMCR